MVVVVWSFYGLNVFYVGALLLRMHSMQESVDLLSRDFVWLKF